MNRTMTYIARENKLAPTAIDRFFLLLTCIIDSFARSEVQGMLRLTGVAAVFMLLLGVICGIESGVIALLPGAVLCLSLAALAFLLVRRLHELI